ncbi:hypothetical protein [Raoultella ornithinolytica]|uniref:hypothetical protein n=1 Tax=Raoultella ornithinolytica TaxID=54291 RepID=UPI002478D8B8|nr:hypothetical protein [Raoultella ornithinolytica]MDH7610252.1 hypothetical protein [Raoultella ornithinolytica]HDV9412472.1 hypothetical protein [Raoultella ornithinolytica]
MAILGQILIPFPAFFDAGRIDEKKRVAIFPAIRGNSPIFILHFSRLIGIKRRARLIKKSARSTSRDATSSRVKQSVFTEIRRGVLAPAVVCLALAYRWPVSGQCGGDIR